MKTAFLLLFFTVFFWATPRDFLSSQAGFIATKQPTEVYDMPNGKSFTRLDILQSCDVLSRTNISQTTWYQIRFQTGNDDTPLTGWIKGENLFCEADFQVVKKISEWFLFVEYPETMIVFHVHTNGVVFFYENGETTKDRLKVYETIFFLGRAMMYYDGKNPPIIPWAKTVDLITNRELFPLEEDLRQPLPRTFLLTGDRVNVRDYPSTNGKILAQLPINSEVLFLWRTGKKQTIANKKGYWARVILPKKKIHGYLFDAYLKPKP